MQQLNSDSVLSVLLWGLEEMQTVTFAVTGPSMGPTILSGDRVVLGKVKEGPKPGGVYFYLGAKNEPTIHRLLEINANTDGRNHFIFKGDNCLTPDPPVFLDAIRAEVVAVHSSPWRRFLHFFRRL